MARIDEIAKKLVSGGRGILAADESNRTANKRFKAVGVDITEENRRKWRQVLLTTPKLNQYLDGVILYDETFWQSADNGKPFRDLLKEQGISPGIKVDEGLVDMPYFPGEQITRGLDNLPERLEKYAQFGAEFTKWRSVITIGEDTPTEAAVEAISHTMAVYAGMVQQANMVPILEPEILFDGEHSIELCEDVMIHTLSTLFRMLDKYQINLPGAILKTSMVLPGKQSGIEFDTQDIARRTSRALKNEVPPYLGGVVFLSGGQTPAQAMLNLDAIEGLGPYPWGLTFSYSRALQEPVLEYWSKDMDQEGAQSIFTSQLRLAVKARAGKLKPEDLV